MRAHDGERTEEHRGAPGEEFEMSRKVVWRSDGTSPCSGCGQLPARCRCSAATPSAVPTGPARIRIEKRRGKTVTVVDEIPLVEKDVKALLRNLKKRLASGGTCKQFTIELQGDHVDGVRKWLEGHSIPHRGWH
jgi:translation initiation factor 1